MFHNSFVFWLHEVARVHALREGHWLLLDEPCSVWQSLAAVLDSFSGSVVLRERGDANALFRNREFRLFASMSPPTDFGKNSMYAALSFTRLYADREPGKDRARVFLIRGLFADVTLDLPPAIRPRYTEL
eukprot:254958_1